MATSEPTPTIASTAKLSLHNFQQCLHLAARLHPQQLAMAEDQLARFSLWASGIGVFAGGRASMDHRLREAPDIQDAVVSLLDDLADSIQDCSVIIESILESEERVADITPTAAGSELELSFRAVASEINMLYRLSNTIRRASRESQNLKVSKSYRIRDDEGNDAEEQLQQIFTYYIRERFPEIREDLCQRLATAMISRRRRILYRRSRYGNSPIRTNQTVSKPKMKAPQSQREIPVILDVADEAAGATATAAHLAPAKSTVQSLAVSATTLAAADYKKASAPSVISATRTVALGNEEGLVFPPAPNGRIIARHKARERELRAADHAFHSYLKDEYADTPEIDDSEIEKIEREISEADTKLRTDLELDWADCHKAIPELICPYCLYALPSLSVSDDKKWKSHIMNDLDAYVCLFDECEKSEELYRHSSDWLQHMRGHTLRWRCNAKSHGTQTFLTENIYLEHMRSVHAGSFTEPQLRALSERNGRSTGPMFPICPICGAEDSADTMEAHVVNHLRALALRSLPPYEDEGLDAGDEERETSGESRPFSRSTLKLDNERDIIPVFEDLDGHDTWTFDSKVQTYRRWGGYRNYILEAVKNPQRGQSSIFSPMVSEDRVQDDPSSLFVEGSLFDGVRPEDRRKFEWGFGIKQPDESLAKFQDDPVIQRLRYQQTMGSATDEGITTKHIVQPQQSPRFEPRLLRIKPYEEGMDSNENDSSKTPTNNIPDESPTANDANVNETTQKDIQTAVFCRECQDQWDAAEPLSNGKQRDLFCIRCQSSNYSVKVDLGIKSRSADRPNANLDPDLEESKSTDLENDDNQRNLGTEPSAGLRIATGSSGAHISLSKAPPSPLLESYHGTYQSMSPMPSPLLVSEAIDMIESDDEDTTLLDSSWDAQENAARLAIALKGDDRMPDTEPLIDILPGLTHEQVMDLRVEYKKLVKTGSERKGVNVAKHIRARLKDGPLMKACYTAALGQWESEAYWANFFYHGDNTRHELLIEVLMGRTNYEIRKIKDSFSDKRYGNSLTRCMKMELKEDKFKKAVSMVLDETRMEEHDEHGRLIPIDTELVGTDVKQLRDAIVKEQGGESLMISIVVQRSDSHLRKVLKQYEAEYGSNFARDALKKSGNRVGELLAHILNGVINKPARDALLLNHAMYAAGQEEFSKDLLISRLVRLHWNKQHVNAVIKAYRERYQHDFHDALKVATSGEWGKFCRRLCDPPRGSHRTDNIAVSPPAQSPAAGGQLPEELSEALAGMTACEHNSGWVEEPGGYMCPEGSHFVSDSDFRKLFTSAESQEATPQEVEPPFVENFERFAPVQITDNQQSVLSAMVDKMRKDLAAKRSDPPTKRELVDAPIGRENPGVSTAQPPTGTDLDGNKRNAPSDEEIERGLEAAVKAVWRADPINITARRVCSHAEEALGLESGFLRTDEWKDRSERIIRDSMTKLIETPIRDSEPAGDL